MRFLTRVLTVGALSVSLSGCATMRLDAAACDALKDGTFAVGTFGCMKIQEPSARDVCTKAALAGALVARAACIAKLTAGQGPIIETGDPKTPEDAALEQDARAIVDEWRALEYPPR